LGAAWSQVVGALVRNILAPLLASLLLGVAPDDYSIIAMDAVVLITTAGFAAYFPSRRAADLDP